MVYMLPNNNSVSSQFKWSHGSPIELFTVDRILFSFLSTHPVAQGNQDSNLLKLQLPP